MKPTSDSPIIKKLGKKHGAHKKRPLWAKLAIGFVILGAAGFMTLFGFFIYISSSLPQVKEINNQQVDESTKIYDREGKVLLYEIHGSQKRTVVTFDEIPDFVKHATVSIEDADFYKNPAFDWRGIMRAIWVDVTRGGVFQGGSTITQQLAKNAFLTPERTVIRKLKELVLAVRLEKYYTKDEILELYLNEVPYGSNVYGIEAASYIYFNKSAKDLTLNESAMIASLTKAPTYYSPWGENLDKLIERKNSLLKKMHELGYVSAEELESALSDVLNVSPRAALGIKAPHFVMYVQDYLNKKYGEQFVKKSGLKVITTLDWEMQQIAEEAVKKGAARNWELYKGKNAALVAADPQTGQILAMVGSADYFDSENEGNFNVAAQGLRQPGSTFKPFAYVTAFQKGFTPDTVIWDVQTEFNGTDDPERSYMPYNFDEKFRGPMLMKEALSQSINIPAVKTLYLAGVEDTIRTAEKFGITTLKDRSRFGLSLVLGGGEIKLTELVGAYGVFATEGFKHESTPILSISSKNDAVLEKFIDFSIQVIDPQYPRLINDILSDSELRAELFHSSLYLTQVPGYQVALKTGTTNNYVDAWTIGYTPNLVTGVWVGNNHREPLQKKGGSILAAVPIWHDFFEKAIKKYPPEIFTKPDPIVTDNPALKGKMPPGEFRSILYYLKRFTDPQFENWENGITEWLKTNTFDQSKFSPDEEQDEQTSESGEISMKIVSPKNGDIIEEDKVKFEVEVKSLVEIEKMETFLNGALIAKVENLSAEFVYSELIGLQDMESQNLFEVMITDKNGLQTKETLILFKNLTE